MTATITMTWLDKFIQRLRIRKALAYIGKQSRVLDIGCLNGELFNALGDELTYGIGIDPLLQAVIIHPLYRLIKGSFPRDMPFIGTVDYITMLAVIEHIPASSHSLLATSCYCLLEKNGQLIITMPSPKADKILAVLLQLRLIKGISLEQHYGLSVSTVKSVFVNTGFKLVTHQTFQSGFNNILVFEKP